MLTKLRSLKGALILLRGLWVHDLVEELRSRSVIRALIAYSVVAWMLLQVADVTFDRLPIPDNAMTVLIVLVILGFPVVGILPNCRRSSPPQTCT